MAAALRSAVEGVDQTRASALTSAAFNALSIDADGMVDCGSVTSSWLRCVLPTLEKGRLETGEPSGTTPREGGQALGAALDALLGNQLGEIVLEQLGEAQSAVAARRRAAAGPLPDARVQLVSMMLQGTLRESVASLGDVRQPESNRRPASAGVEPAVASAGVSPRGGAGVEPEARIGWNRT